MITRRYRNPRGINENTAFYGLYVRVSGEARDMLKEAQEIAARKLGAVPSNPMLLDELTATYIRCATESGSDTNRFETSENPELVTTVKQHKTRSSSLVGV